MYPIWSVVLPLVAHVREPFAGVQWKVFEFVISLATMSSPAVNTADVQVAVPAASVIMPFPLPAQPVPVAAGPQVNPDSVLHHLALVSVTKSVFWVVTPPIHCTTPWVISHG